MTRRTWASLVALALLIAFAVTAVLLPTPYVVFRPGPTLNVLGDFEKSPIIHVSGHATYRDGGELRLLTITTTPQDTRVHLPELLLAWLNPDDAVYPRDVIYAPTDTRASVRQESTLEMSSSQDNAAAAALTALHLPVGKVTKIASVNEDSPAAGKLKAGDVIEAVNQAPVTTAASVVQAIRMLPVGSPVQVTVKRSGTERSYRLTTTASTVDPTMSALRVQVGEDFSFPFQVEVRLSERIGGPSGGMMFALGIYDVLTPGSLTAGKDIAGTGEIDPAGRVGAIGGIGQKIVAAQASGAKLFLVPAGNCAEALASQDDPKKMRLVKVSTFAQALSAVRSWAADPGTSLPRCTP